MHATPAAAERYNKRTPGDKTPHSAIRTRSSASKATPPRRKPEVCCHSCARQQKQTHLIPTPSSRQLHKRLCRALSRPLPFHPRLLPFVSTSPAGTTADCFQVGGEGGGGSGCRFRVSSPDVGRRHRPPLGPREARPGVLELGGELAFTAAGKCGRFTYTETERSRFAIFCCC